jgi:7,8-dihydro-6-hydroxymethylpterin-pyrophosphokinase
MIFSSGARQASTAIFARRQAYEREGGERERERERPRELDGDCFVYGRNNPWKY